MQTAFSTSVRLIDRLRAGARGGSRVRARKPTIGLRDFMSNVFNE